MYVCVCACMFVHVCVCMCVCYSEVTAKARPLKLVGGQ